MVKKAWIYNKVFLPLLLGVAFNLLFQTPVAKQEPLPRQEVRIESEELKEILNAGWQEGIIASSLPSEESTQGTEREEEVIPSEALEDNNPLVVGNTEIPTDQLDPKVIGKNKDLNSTNIAFLWTDQGRLKVLTVMAINHDRKRVGIATFPLFGYHEKAGEEFTVAEVFKQKGREGLLTTLEDYLEVDIPFYVGIEQQVLVEMSELLGNIDVNGEDIAIAEAFTQTSTGVRSDDEAVVQAIGTKLKESGSWLVIPQLAWMMVQEVDTNLTSKDVWQLFREFQREMSSETLRKNSLKGETYYNEGKKYRKIEEEVWINILDQVTREQ